MNFSHALNEVARHYVLGCAEHYDRQVPNPWQQMHDDLEKLVGMDELIFAAGVEGFTARALELIDLYKRLGLWAASVSVADAFVIGDLQAVKDKQSVKHHECAKCGSKENLRLEPVSFESLNVRVVCLECRGSIQ